ncbi:MAG: hypothetical protein PVG49_17965, partial [Desulfobacteraceae bacterium]
MGTKRINNPGYEDGTGFPERQQKPRLREAPCKSNGLGIRTKLFHELKETTFTGRAFQVRTRCSRSLHELLPRSLPHGLRACQRGTLLRF